MFSPRTLLIIIAVGVLAFVGMLYLQLFGEAGDPGFEIGPSTYSSSAIGHKALLETLRRLDIPVVISRFRSGEKATGASLLVLAEPDDSETAAVLLGGFGNLPHGLLVMPKWEGTRDRSKPLGRTDGSCRRGQGDIDPQDRLQFGSRRGSQIVAARSCARSNLLLVPP